MRNEWTLGWSWRASAVVLAGGLLALGTGIVVTQAGEPKPEIINLIQGHMVKHPAGAHYVLWNGPAFLDIGVPTGGFVRFEVATVGTQWRQPNDGQGQPLPVLVRYNGRGLVIGWLPYHGPGTPPAAQIGKGMSDEQIRAALNAIHESRMNTARNIR